MLINTLYPHTPVSTNFNIPCPPSGGVGEADPAGGDTPQQVLQPVEEVEGEGDPAGDLWQRKGNYPTKKPTNTRLIPLSHHESLLAFSLSVTITHKKFCYINHETVMVQS